MQAPSYRARSVPELLDAAFQFLRAYYVPLVAGTAVLLVPPSLLSFIAPPLAPLASLMQRLAFIGATGVTIAMVSDAYLGRTPDVRRALSLVGKRFRPLWSAGIMSSLATALGLLLLIVPGVIFFAWTAVMQVAVMVEGCNSSVAWDRSKSLSGDNIKRILATSGLSYLILLGAVFGAGVGVTVLAAPLGISDSGVSLLVDVIVALVYPFPSIVATLLYYDLRIRKEGLDVQMAALALGEEPQGAPQLAV